MWNSFDKSSMKIERAEQTRTLGGLEINELIAKGQSLQKKSAALPASQLKSELICFILENASIVADNENIFLHKFNHGGIMYEFLEQKWQYAECVKISESIESYQNNKFFEASLDFGHIAPDWQYLLNRGIPGVISDLEKASESHGADKKAYYSERISVYVAIRDFFIRSSELISSEDTEKSSFTAYNLSQLASSAPQTLAQAMQFILIFYCLTNSLDVVTVRSLGGLDRMLYPFYKNDLENGRYSHEQLVEITKYFLWTISCMKTTANLPFYICGMDENGNDATNEFTDFLLSRYRELDIYDPKIHVLYHKNMNKKTLSLILEMIREGKNSFVFMNTDLTSTALESIGISHEDAKKVIVYGCYETAAEGTEVPCTCGGKINLAKSIEIVLNSKKQFASFDEFLEEVILQLENYTEICMNTISGYEPFCEHICPSMFLSPTYKNSRESGIDLYSGGAKYNNTSIVGAGMATLVDSLVAVKGIVFDEKLKSLDELREILQSNWAQNEKLRLFIKKKYPKFGNNNQESDRIATLIYNHFADLINGRKNGRGGVFRCGMFSVNWRFYMGAKTGATADGRLSGEPLSKNLCASIGQDKNGVTAYLQSVLKFDASKVPDGYVADVVLHQSAVRGEEGMTAFKGLLQTFMDKGGFSVHFNILSPDTLINAQKEPDKYRNLQIRLCGWNVRFIDLDKFEQDEFIKQSLNTM